MANVHTILRNDLQLGVKWQSRFHFCDHTWVLTFMLLYTVFCPPVELLEFVLIGKTLNQELLEPILIGKTPNHIADSHLLVCELVGCICYILDWPLCSPLALISNNMFASHYGLETCLCLPLQWPMLLLLFHALTLSMLGCFWPMPFNWQLSVKTLASYYCLI